MEYASHGVGAAGLTTGIIGTALGVLNGGFLNGNGLLGGGNSCHENTPVNRYELAQESKIADLHSQIALRDANTYNDQKMLDMYKYIDGRFNSLEGQISAQNVVNAQVTANISCMQNTINTLVGLTKTVIPIGNVCPEPMAKYNSWVAPTATA